MTDPYAPKQITSNPDARSGMWRRATGRALHEVPDPPLTLQCPVSGGAFDFEIEVVCWWQTRRATLLSPQALDGPRRDVHRQIEPWLRERARLFAPDQFAEAEQRINNELAVAWPYEANKLFCAIHTRVRPGQELRQLLQEQWKEASRADHVRSVTERWLRFLRDFPADPLALPALELAADDVASVVRNAQIARNRVDEQIAATRKNLRDIAQQARKQHERLDVYEYVTSYESALRKLLDVVAAEGFDGVAAAS